MMTMSAEAKQSGSNPYQAEDRLSVLKLMVQRKLDQLKAERAAGVIHKPSRKRDA